MVLRTWGAAGDVLTHFRSAETLHRFERWDEAAEQLSQAEALFREMGMPWWLEQAEALRARLASRTPWKGFAPYAE